MRIGTTPNHRVDILEEINPLSRLGFDFIELHTNNLQVRNKKEEILNCARKLGLDLTGHLPDVDLCNPNLSRNRELHQRFSEDIEVLHELDIEKVVIHACARHEVNISDFPKTEIEKLKLQRLKELAEKCENYDMRLCLENTEEKPEDFEFFFKELPSLFFCLDIGHANLFAHNNRSLDFLEKYGGRLKHVHICDNFGGYSEKCDIHLPLGTGNMNYTPIIQYLKKIEYDDTITLEIVSNYREEYLKASKKILNSLLNDIYSNAHAYSPINKDEV